jgi:hypothetical protein
VLIGKLAAVLLALPASELAPPACKGLLLVPSVPG